MSKTIRVTSISSEKLARLNAKGIEVLVVTPLKALHGEATTALKKGNVAAAKSARLKMLKP
jgi:predicted Fe-Mo cluster-binding NifX family protein